MRAHLEPAPGFHARRAAIDRARSITARGRLMRSLSQSKVSRPPASAQRRRRSARERHPLPARRRLEELKTGHHVADHGHVSSPYSLGEGGERLVVVGTALERVEDHVGHDRRAAELVAAQRVGDRANQRGRRRRLGGSPMPLAPTGLCGSAHVDEVGLEHRGTSRMEGGLAAVGRCVNGSPFCGSKIALLPRAMPKPWTAPPLICAARPRGCMTRPQSVTAA